MVETTQIIVSQAHVTAFVIGLAMALMGFVFNFLVFFPVGGDLESTEDKLNGRDTRLLSCLFFQWIGWMLVVAAGVMHIS
jgi:hypothetical protein